MIDQTALTWPVAQDYEWCRVPAVGLLAAPEPHVWILRPIGPVRRTYRPLIDTPRLFRDFAAVPLGNAAAFRDFALRYGLLGLRPFPARDWLPDNAATGELGNPHPPEQSWSEELQAIWSTLERWDALKRRHSNNAEILIPRRESERMRRAPKERARRIENAALSTGIADRVNEAIERHEIRPELHAISAGRTVRFVHEYRPRTLVGAMWLQTIWAVTGRQDFARCLNCGAWLHSGREGSKDTKRRRSHAKYCNDVCRASWNQRKKSKEKTDAVPAQ